jgi:sterol desaturase/sphingolipid hydroxylase (fatty acid hydroxylase superfamily)
VTHTTDIVYAIVVRIVLFPLIAYFEYDFLQRSLAGFVKFFGLTPPSLPDLVGSSTLAFLLGFAVFDLTDSWRHRLAHRFGWFYGVHSLHHTEDHMTFWSDERMHLLEEAITYVMPMAVGLAIGISSFQFPFVILGFRLIGSVAHANTCFGYGWLGDRLIVSPQFHRIHHALRSAGRGISFSAPPTSQHARWRRKTPPPSPLSSRETGGSTTGGIASDAAAHQSAPVGFWGGASKPMTVIVDD